MSSSLRGFKLFRVRKDGTLGSLFINTRARLPLNRWLTARCHPTKGFKVRPGWHVCPQPKAPHLSKRGREWFEVEMRGVTSETRPKSQGGLWYLAKEIKIIDNDPAEDHLY